MKSLYIFKLFIVCNYLVDVPPRPSIVEVKNIPGPKIKVGWVLQTEIPDGLKFTVSLEDASGKLKNSVEYTVKDRSSRFFSTSMDVERFIRYRVIIRPCVLEVCGLDSEPKFITTEEGVPSKVQNLTLTNHIDSVEISWSKPAKVPGIIRKYILNVKRVGISEYGYPKYLSNTTTKYKMVDLAPYQNLVAEVTAHTVADGPVASENFVSPEGTPGHPTNLSAILLKNDMFSIRWAPPRYPNGVIQGYGVGFNFIQISIFCVLVHQCELRE